MAYSLLHLIVRLLAFSGGQHQHVQINSPWAPPPLLQQLQQHQPYPPWLNMPASAEPMSWLSETTSVPKSGREFNNRRILKDGGTSVAEPSTGIWTLGTSSLVATSPLFGGPHGRSFDDSEVVGMFGRTISKVVLHGSKERLTGISFKYSDNLERRHGTYGKSSLELEVSKENPITKMSFVKCKKGRPGREHTRVCGATFATKVKEVSLGKESGKTPDPNEQTLDVPEKFEVIGMSGRDGQRLDQASIIAINRDKISSMPPAPNTGYWTQLPLVPCISYSSPLGAEGDGKFDILSDIKFDISNVRVKTLTLYGNTVLSGIFLDYDNGLPFKAGATNEKMKQYKLDGERINRIEVGVCDEPGAGDDGIKNMVCQVVFHTDKQVITSPVGTTMLGNPIPMSSTSIDIPQETEFIGIRGFTKEKKIRQLSVVIASTSSAALPPK